MLIVIRPSRRREGGFRCTITEIPYEAMEERNRERKITKGKNKRNAKSTRYGEFHDTGTRVCPAYRTVVCFPREGGAEDGKESGAVCAYRREEGGVASTNIKHDCFFFPHSARHISQALGTEARVELE